MIKISKLGKIQTAFYNSTKIQFIPNNNANEYALNQMYHKNTSLKRDLGSETHLQ